MIGLVIAVGIANADTVSVPGDADTLGEALDLAGDGDTIELAPGDYDEQVTVVAAVSIVGTGGLDVTHLNGRGTDDVITVTVPGVSISGLTLDADGRAGVAVEGGSATLTDLRFVRFGTVPDEDDNVGAVEAFGSTVTLSDVLFDGGGSAIVAAQSDLVLSRVTVDGSTPFGNLAAIEVFGGTLTGSDLTLTDVTGTAVVRTADAAVALVRANVQCNTLSGSAMVLVGPSIDLVALLIGDTTASPLLELRAGTAATIRNTTLIGASPDTVLLSVAGDVGVRSTILARSSKPVEVGSDSKLSGGWNLFDDGTEVPPELASDAVEGDPLLIPDGRVCTTPLGPVAGSPAIDAGDPADTDRNGSPTDIGATGGPDGFVIDLDDDGARSDVDCDDTDPERFPGADDPPGDDIDQDCSDNGPVDGDGDGSPFDEDCDDGDPGAYPGAEEVWYDGVDQDCAGGDDNDADADGFGGIPAGGPDCDDTDPAIRPGAEEDLDPVDRDCDGFGDPTGSFEPVGCAVAGGSSVPVLAALLLARRGRRRNVPSGPA